MDYTQLLTELNLSERSIEVKIINPIRKGDSYKSGKVVGFKAGIVGGGWKFKNGEQKSFDSSKFRWLRKPKVFIIYPIFNLIPKAKWIADWIDVDNCEFSIVENL